METFKPIQNFLGAAAFLASVGMSVPLASADARGGSALASSELSRRRLAIDEAQELLRKGDEAYTAGRYGQAVEAYAGARELIPDAPVTAELRAAATERYAQASVEQARVLARNGDVAGARAAVDKVLLPSVAPNHPGAVNYLGQLDDPIRTNPAANAAHTQDVDSVRRLLYTAEGAFNLGKLDEANLRYSDVLRIDPTNSAARRGMERVASAKSDYQKSAYDHARAEMLNQVESQWELQVPSVDLEASMPDPGAELSSANFVSVKDKLDRIIIPKVALDQTSLSEAIDFLRIRANENDKLELDPARRGINFTVSLGASDSPVAQKINAARFDLQLTNVPLSQILTYIGQMTGTTFATDEFAVIITPIGSSSPDLISRTYRVPPDFISSMSAGADGAAAATDDPFGAAPSSGGLLAKRMSAQEALAKQGVAFPEGASANYMASTNTLRVVNTASNQDYIAQVIEAITRVEPVMVSVKVTMIKVEQTHLEELGFDWFLESANFKGDLVGAGGTVGNGRSSPDVVGPNGATALNPVTAGNRTGDSAISGNSIDNLLTNQSGRQASNPAPGILGLYGNFNDANVQMLMRGLDQKKGVDILAQPATVTRSGQSSNIEIVREFIYPTEYEPPELPNTVGSNFGGVTPVTPATPTAFETKEVGITLEILPVVDASKQYITVTLNPIFSDFLGFVNYGSPINTTATNALGISETVVVTENAILMPIFSKDTVSTTVDVVDGGTVAVGGLIQETSQVVNDKTPILGSIPIVGRLFQSDAKQPVKKVIIFLVNVELMDPTGYRFRNR
ncbi:MAG: Amuc_1098 family type IV pilus outer membrane protein [Luteolibacter sp.]